MHGIDFLFFKSKMVEPRMKINSDFLAPIKPRNVSILGSTGSVGCSTVDLVARYPDRFPVQVLVANKNWQLLAQQAKQLRPKLVVIADSSYYNDLKNALSNTQMEISAGEAAVVEAASYPTDWTMSAIVGAAGLKPTMAAIKQGKIVALANKESLVCGGQLLMQEVKKYQTQLVPTDSEHSAIFQVFEKHHSQTVEKIILTASGGPFRQWSVEKMADITPEQAVAHPNWSMGQKISIDSATMMNKGLELIEAFHLFGMNEKQIDIVVHPQSIIHSLVSYIDGSVLAQLGMPDMRTPIAYALSWPTRIQTPVKRLNLIDIMSMSFEAPDIKRFPCLRLARQVIELGEGATTVLNAANEVAVEYFLNRKISFLNIPAVVEATLDSISDFKVKNIDEIFYMDCLAREKARMICHGKTSNKSRYMNE